MKKRTKPTKLSKPFKPYWEMTAAELAQATKEFDKPLPASRFKPLSKAQRARFERVRRAGGPAIHRIFAFDIDAELVSSAAAYAKRKKISLTELVERGLRGVLAAG